MRTPPGKVNIPFRDLIVASVHFHVFCPGYHVYARAAFAVFLSAVAAVILETKV